MSAGGGPDVPNATGAGERSRAAAGANHQGVSLRGAVGKPAIGRADAEQLGAVRAFAVDAGARRVTTLVLAAGRTARLVDWGDVESIGPDALIVKASREPAEGDDRIVGGTLDPLQKRVLSDLGNELGAVTDVTVDDDGRVVQLETPDHSLAGNRLRGIGSYAVVVEADPAER